MNSQGFGHFQPPPASGSGGRQIAQQLMLESFSLLEQVPSSPTPVAVSPDRREFPLIATAMNIALELFESPTGKHLLHDLGLILVREWVARGSMAPFHGDVTKMADYVDYFVRQKRHDPPNVVINRTMVNRDHIASLVKHTPVTSQLHAFSPRTASHFQINRRLVEAMVENDCRLWQALDGQAVGGRGTGQAESQEALRYLPLHLWGGLFHESCHAFTAYLAGNAHLHTPPNVSYLSYGGDQPASRSGESGRWAENWLLGGSLELYYDPDDDAFQPGLPHLLDQLERAWPIKAAAIQSFIGNVGRCDFPLRTGSTGISLDDRIRYRIVSLGFNDPVPIEASQQTMRALREAGEPPAYNIPVRDLRALALDHRVRVRIVPAN